MEKITLPMPSVVHHLQQPISWATRTEVIEISHPNPPTHPQQQQQQQVCQNSGLKNLRKQRTQLEFRLYAFVMKKIFCEIFLEDWNRCEPVKHCYSRRRTQDPPYVVVWLNRQESAQYMPLSSSKKKKKTFRIFQMPHKISLLHLSIRNILISNSRVALAVAGKWIHIRFHSGGHGHKSKLQNWSRIRERSWQRGWTWICPLGQADTDSDLMGSSRCQ